MILASVGGVGMPDGLMLRHLVQTLQLWAGVVCGFRESKSNGWIGLPLFVFWAGLMTLIWLYLLGVSHVINGHFSPLEIAMTIVVSLASVVGIAMFWRFKSGTSAPMAASLFVVFAAFQLACFRISFLPSVARR
jgi:hypothetical protein